MIFIATTANASANNLGKIVIKNVEDINQSTIDLLTFFGKSWADEQKVEIDNFLETFNLASWKTKVKAILMPILCPVANNLVNSNLTATDSIYRKNIVDGSFIPSAGSALLAPLYGYFGISQNGMVLQNGTNGDMAANLSVPLTVTQFGITNKNLHFGIYHKESTKFRSGSSGANMPYMEGTTTQETANLSNSFSFAVNNIPPRDRLLIINGNVDTLSGKSYVNKKLINNTFQGITTSTVQTKIDYLAGGGNNIANDSTCCFMTFGESLTDSELTEYADMINTLMNALFVN